MAKKKYEILDLRNKIRSANSSIEQSKEILFMLEYNRNKLLESLQEDCVHLGVKQRQAIANDRICTVCGLVEYYPFDKLSESIVRENLHPRQFRDYVNSYAFLNEPLPAE